MPITVLLPTNDNKMISADGVAILLCGDPKKNLRIHIIPHQLDWICLQENCHMGVSSFVPHST